VRAGITLFFEEVQTFVRDLRDDLGITFCPHPDLC
jgi:hypothetical protein